MMKPWEPPKRGGKQPGAGRPKGSKNAVHVEVVDDILRAYRDLGGIAYLVETGKERPDLFLSLLAKTLPKNIHAQIDLRNVVKVIDLSGESQNDDDDRVQDKAPG